MSKKRSVKRVLSLLLACLMILNAPLSALAAEELQIVDMEVLADDGLIGSEDPVLVSDSTAGGTSENGPFEDTFTSEGAATLEEVGDDLFEDDGLVMDDSPETAEESLAQEEQATEETAETETETVLAEESERETESEEELLLMEEEAELDGQFLATGTGETIPAKSVNVYLTVSNKGVLASAKDGSAMVCKEVTVTDVNSDGVLTYNEALIAAHTA